MKFLSSTVTTGISFGSALAMVISYANWHSIPWAILHGLFGWFTLYITLYSNRSPLIPLLKKEALPIPSGNAFLLFTLLFPDHIRWGEHPQLLTVLDL